MNGKRSQHDYDTEFASVDFTDGVRRNLLSEKLRVIADMPSVTAALTNRDAQALLDTEPFGSRWKRRGDYRRQISEKTSCFSNHEIDETMRRQKRLKWQLALFQSHKMAGNHDFKAVR
jgi:hypothetical protein